MITVTINEHADRYVHGTLYKILKINMFLTFCTFKIYKILRITATISNNTELPVSEIHVLSKQSFYK